MTNGGRDNGNGPERKLAIIGSIIIGITGFATLFWLAIEDPSRRDCTGRRRRLVIESGHWHVYRGDGRETGKVGKLIAWSYATVDVSRTLVED